MVHHVQSNKSPIIHAKRELCKVSNHVKNIDILKIAMNLWIQEKVWPGEISLMFSPSNGKSICIWWIYIPKVPGKQTVILSQLYLTIFFIPFFAHQSKSCPGRSDWQIWSQSLPALHRAIAERPIIKREQKTTLSSPPRSPAATVTYRCARIVVPTSRPRSGSSVAVARGTVGPWPQHRGHTALMQLLCNLYHDPKFIVQMI